MNNRGYHFCLNVELFVTWPHLLKATSALYLPTQIAIPSYQKILFWPMDHLMLSCTGRGRAQSKCSASVRDRCGVLLLQQIIWLSRHTNLIPCAGEEIYFLKLKSLPKGKVALIRNLYCSFAAHNFSICFSQFCNSMSRENWKSSWMKLSETKTQ